MSRFSEQAAKRNARKNGRDKSLRPSRAAELRYVMIATQVTAMWAACVSRVLPRYESRLLATERYDAKTKAQRAAIRAFTSEVSMQFGEAVERAKPIRIGLQDVGKRSLVQSEKETRRLGIVIKKEPDMARKLAGWREENLKLIKSLGTSQVDRLREVLEESGDLTAKGLAALIEDRVGVTQSKAYFLARDQSLKLNAQITQDRMAAAGIEEYRWRTSRDERVRERHKELEGERFRFDDPPETNDAGDKNNPGEDYQCRCTSEPVIPGVDDDDDD